MQTITDEDVISTRVSTPLYTPTSPEAPSFLSSRRTSRTGTETSYGEEKEDTDTESLTESLYATFFTPRYGRTYHTNLASVYELPNDEVEVDRLNRLHELFPLDIGGKLHLAPIENPSRVLDVGTGTGRWAIAMAVAHPRSTVIGVDISPIQETDGPVPSNLVFECDNICTGLRYPDASFDLIRSRAMALGIDDWAQYLREVNRLLAPGGWLCIVEPHFGTLGMPDTSACPIYRYNEILHDVCRMISLNPSPADEICRTLHEIGLHNTQRISDVKTLKSQELNGSETASDESRGCTEICKAFILATAGMLKQHSGYSPEYIDLMCANARARLTTNSSDQYSVRVDYITVRKD